MNINKTKTWIQDIFFIMLGSFLYSFATNCIYKQYKLISTGFNGIALLLHYSLGSSISIVSFILNIIIVIIGVRFVNKTFTIKSLIGISMVSLFLQVTNKWTIHIDNIIIAIIFGSVVLGTGVGIALRHDGALGGMNIFGKIINKYFGLTIGTVDMIFNLILIIIAAIIFDINIALYTILARYITNKVIDNILEGFNRKKTVIIISDKHKEISHKIMTNSKRGVTFLRGEGGFTSKEKKVIYCVVKLTQISKIKQIVKIEDSKAFMTIIDTKEVLGKGFY